MIRVKIDPSNKIAYVHGNGYAISAPLQFTLEAFSEADRQAVSRIDFLANAVQAQIKATV